MYGIETKQIPMVTRDDGGSSVPVDARIPQFANYCLDKFTMKTLA